MGVCYSVDLTIKTKDAAARGAAPTRKEMEMNHGYLSNLCNVFYFAYGSNMNPERIRQRLPNARAVGTATVRGWRLAERLYADIERAKGGRVHGVVYLVTQSELRTLDHYEGYPTVYRNALVTAHLDGTHKVRALTYMMTEAARKDRKGKPYPEDYRRICSVGADAWEIPNGFKRRGDRPLARSILGWH